MSNKKIALLISLSLTTGASHAVEAAGYVEQYSKNFISGWACDRHDSDYSVNVHIWREDGHFLAGTGTSNVRESAVAAACGSMHSNHGFSIDLNVPYHLLDNKNHKVQVWIIPRIGEPRQLYNSPVSIYFDNGQPPPPPPEDPYADAPKPRPMQPVYLGQIPSPPIFRWPQCNADRC